MTKSINGSRNLIGVVYVLAFSPEPLTLYQISKILGLGKSTVKSVLDYLLSEGHIIRLDDGRYTVNPDFVYVYDGVAIYKFSPDHYMVLMPDYDDRSSEYLARVFSEVLSRLPSSVRVWIDMEPRRFDTPSQYKNRDE